MKCHSESEVIAFLSPKLQTMLEPVVDGLKEWNEKEIERVVYRPAPSVYGRTGEFKQAWDGEIEGGSGEATATFEYHPEKMSVGSNDYESSDYGVHVSVIDGSDIRDSLADIIYESGAGPVFGEGYWTSPRNAWKELVRIASGAKMKTWISRGASKAGLKISW